MHVYLGEFLGKNICLKSLNSRIVGTSGVTRDCHAIGTLIGEVGAPAAFGALIESNSKTHLVWGYAMAAGLMLVALLVEMSAGVVAEGLSLEKNQQALVIEGHIVKPLSPMSRTLFLSRVWNILHQRP
jgi:hypothetical protein